MSFSHINKDEEFNEPILPQSIGYMENKSDTRSSMKYLVDKKSVLEDIKASGGLENYIIQSIYYDGVIDLKDNSLVDKEFKNIENELQSKYGDEIYNYG